GILIKAGQLNKTLLIKSPQFHSQSGRLPLGPIERKNIYDPLEITVLNFLDFCSIKNPGGIILDIYSEIPVASGMGSGAAIALATIKGLAGYFHKALTREEMYKQVLEIEKIYHGNPSGVDPTVIVYEKPVYFIRDKKLETLEINAEFSLC